MKNTYIALILMIAGKAGAQIPVTDLAHIGTSQMNWVAEAGEWASSEGNQLEQISNQIQQINRMQTELQRMGDPATLAGQLGLDQLLDITKLTNPGKSYESYSSNANGTDYLKRLGVSSGSVKNPEAYRQYATHAAIADDYKARSEDGVQAKAKLQAEMDQTSKNLDSATTDAEVQRAAAKMAVLQGQMAALNNKDVAAAAQSTIEANNMEIDRRAKTQAEAEKMDKDRAEAMENASQGTVPQPKPVEDPFLK